MTAPEQWSRVRDLFEQAVDLPPGDREAWLGQQTGDPDVLAEVASLLKHDTRAGAFLDAPIRGPFAEPVESDSRFGPGDCVGAYQIRKELGRGGMGYVYLARDSKLGRDVALKVLAPGLVRDNGQRERLRREARAAAALTHPGICTIYALEEIGDDVVIAAEYIDGHTLREEIAAGRRPTADDLQASARELASALAAAHARRITHRDLKPENVMRASSGHLKILDFGLALVAADASGLEAARVTVPGTFVGTPAYMAPEQLEARQADLRTDLFAFGVLIYEYATGVHPFDAQSPMAMAARILNGEHAGLGAVRPDLPEQLTAIVERCLRKRPEDRFASAGEVAAALAAPRARPARSGAVVWWRNHLAIVLATYVAAAAVAWLAKELDHGVADAGFVLIAMLAMIGGTLRGHLLFAERTHNGQTFRRELRRSRVPLDAVDLVMGLALVSEGLWAARVRPVAGVLIIGLGLGIALARMVLERSTTHVAFGNHSETA